MAESTLSLEYVEIASRIARQVGYDPLAANRTADQVTQIDQVIQSGYRQFLFPHQIPGMTAHEWSFLRPFTTLVTVADDYNYTLPDAIGNIEGNMTFATTDNQTGPVVFVGEGEIRRRREANTSTGRPQMFALKPLNVTTGASAGQRFEVILWPTPDGIYTLTYRYTALIDKLTTSLPYPLGGMIHGETILASCQARAEKEIDDVDGGPYFTEFMKRLQSSINSDRLLYGRELYGYNGNRDTRRGGRPNPSGVTYEGVQYGS